LSNLNTGLFLRESGFSDFSVFATSWVSHRWKTEIFYLWRIQKASSKETEVKYGRKVFER